MLGRRHSSPHIIALSSYVAHGSVGLRAVMAVGQASGAKVTALPTVILSNHLGYAAYGKQAVEICALEQMFVALQSTGALDAVDGFLTGYLPTAAHVAVAAQMIVQIKSRNPDCLVMVDPVIGDDPGGAYIDLAAADAIRDTLIRHADIIMPNRFELAFLSGASVNDTASATAAARALAGNAALHVCATSIPAGPHHLSNVYVSGGHVHRTTTARLARAPHGTGDLFSAIVMLRRLQKSREGDAVKYATAMVRHVLTQSGDASELLLERLDLEAAARVNQTIETLA